VARSRTTWDIFLLAPAAWRASGDHPLARTVQAPERTDPRP
jgi:hypothetical protein